MLIALAVSTSACDDDPYPVMSCSPGAGLDLATDGIPRRGEADAPVYLTVFADPRCSFSMKLVLELETYAQGLDDAGRSGELVLHYRHLLRTSFEGSMSVIAARGLAAAHLLGGNTSFWDLYWVLLIQDEVTEELVWNEGLARTPAADQAEFEQVYRSQAVADVLNADQALGQKLGFEETPSVVLCGEHVGPDPDDLIENLEHLIGE